MAKGTRSVHHSDLVLRKASDYVEFDLHSLAATLDILRRLPPGTEIRNAVVDSFLIRARVLIDFFCGDAGQNTDVLAVDYFHDYSLSPYRPTMSEALRMERDKINKRLAHLTTAPMPRLRSNQRYYPRKIVPPVVRAATKWLSLVPDRRLQRGVRKQYEEHLVRLEKALGVRSS